jgi:hypothetical protein
MADKNPREINRIQIINSPAPAPETVPARPRYLTFVYIIMALVVVIILLLAMFMLYTPPTQVIRPIIVTPTAPADVPTTPPPASTSTSY